MRCSMRFLLVIGTSRESIWVVCQKDECLPPSKHSRNRPKLRVGLPKTSQMSWVARSENAPSAVSQMMSSISEASSKTSSIRLPLLWSPAKAWGLVLDHGIMSIRQVRSRVLSLDRSAVAVRVKYSRANQQRLNHLPSSAQVLVLSCGSVLAVTTPRVSGKVMNAQRMSWATVVDFAMPWPDATASMMASSMVVRPDLIRPIKAIAQGIGPVYPSNCVPFCPQGNAPITNANGSSRTSISHWARRSSMLDPHLHNEGARAHPNTKRRETRCKGNVARPHYPAH